MSDNNTIENEITTNDSEIEDEEVISNINIITTILGLPVQTQIIGRSRPREDIVEQHFNKLFKDISGNPIIIHNMDYYIKLKSGEEIYFSEEDGKHIILNIELEPSRLIRNIISKMPFKMSERLQYLGKLKNEINEIANIPESTSLKDKAYKAYILEWRLRYIFKRVLNLWRVKKMDTSSNKELDPITFVAPEKEVTIYDWANRKKFVADAKSLANFIEMKLMYNEYGFPIPMHPKNPFNNMDLSYKQLISIYNQIKNHGELRWAFTTLREHNFNRHRWHLYHKSALTMNAVKHSILYLDCHEARDLFSDFIFAKMEELNIPHSNYIIRAYETAILKVPTHWYLEKFKSLAISHYEAEHFNQNRTRAINDKCVRIFAKQRKFVTDLETKKII